MTLGENIADAGGLKAALKVDFPFPDMLRHTGTTSASTAPKNDFLDWKTTTMSRSSSSTTLRFRFEDTKKIQKWCASKSYQAVIHEFQNEHAPHEYRSNIVLGNEPEFVVAFNCTSNSRMVLRERCRVW